MARDITVALNWNESASICLYMKCIYIDLDDEK